MTRPELANQLIRLVEQEYRVTVSDPSADMIQSLGLDSLDITEMLFKVEEVFSVEISTAEISRCRCLDDVTDLLLGKLGGSLQAPETSAGSA